MALTQSERNLKLRHPPTRSICETNHLIYQIKSFTKPVLDANRSYERVWWHTMGRLISYNFYIISVNLIISPFINCLHRNRHSVFKIKMDLINSYCNFDIPTKSNTNQTIVMVEVHYLKTLVHWIMAVRYWGDCLGYAIVSWCMIRIVWSLHKKTYAYNIWPLVSKKRAFYLCSLSFFFFNNWAHYNLLFN